MQKSKLVELLGTFSKNDWKDFQRFLESSFFNRNEQVVLLFNFLKDKFPESSNPEELPSKETVFKLLFPKKPYSEKELSYQLSHLVKLIEEYFIHTQLDHDQTQKQFLLLESYKARKLDKGFFSVLNKLESTLEKGDIRDRYFFHQKYLLSDLMYNHPSTQKISSDVESLRSSILYFDYYSIYLKLKHAAMFFNRKGIVSEEGTEMLFMDQLLDPKGLEGYGDFPFIRIYQEFIHAFKEDDYSNYEFVKRLVLENINQFSYTEKRDMFAFLLNYCINKSHRKQQAYYRDLFELYKYGLEKEILFENDKITKLDFKNIVTIGCFLDEFEWTHNFIREVGNNLIESERQSIVSLCLAYLSFSQKNFGKTIELLINVEFSDPFDVLMGRSIQYRSYYEMQGYEEVFYDFFNSFSMYLRRNKTLADATKEANLNFIKFAKKIFRYKLLKEKLKPDVKEKLQDIRNIAYRSWLEEKILELSE